MATTIIPAIAALLGVILGGYLESARARRTSESAQLAAYFERETAILRELFETVSAHQHAYGMAIAASMGVLRGMKPDSLTSEKIPWDRLKMLVGLHFPELQPLVKRFDDDATRTGTLIVRAQTGARLSESAKQQIIDQLMAVNNAQSVVYGELERQLLARSEDIRKKMRKAAGLPAAEA
jgi:hypothetical protein